MRKLKYTEKEIKETIKGRQPFSKQDIKFLLKGYYNPAKVPNLSYNDITRFSNAVQTMNRKDDTNFRMRDFFDRRQLKNLERKWKYIPLGDRDIDFDIPTKQKIKPYIEDTKELLELKKLQRAEEREKGDQSFLPSTPLEAPTLDTQISTASRVSPTISGTVDQNTGLTGNETALLSPFEQEIAKRRNQGGIGSLA
jgi:hypothetical protein